MGLASRMRCPVFMWKTLLQKKFVLQLYPRLRALTLGYNCNTHNIKKIKNIAPARVSYNAKKRKDNTILEKGRQSLMKEP